MANIRDVLGKIEIPCNGIFTIPDTVTEIENCAFKDCNNLLVIQIPDSITTIGSRIFDGCCNLKEITIPAKVDTIKHDAFLGWFPKRINVDPRNKFFYAKNNCLITNCDYYDKDESKKEVGKDKYLLRGCRGISTIPEGVTHICSFALSGLNFKTISIPDSVVMIHMGAFEDCKSLTSLTLPNSVEYIDSFAFSGCTSLKQINIPTKIKELDRGLFEGCISLSEIHIPDNVLVNDDTFKGCKNLRKVHIPNFREPEFVGQDDIAEIFKDCNLDEITISPLNKDFKMVNDCVLDKTGKKLILGCNNSIIPHSVEEIGDLAFSGCTKLTKLTIPGNVKSIGWKAFYGCTSLKSINLPDSLEEIKKEAFGNCYNLKAISVTALFDKSKIDYDNVYSFRGAPAAKSIGLWSGFDPEVYFNKLFDEIENEEAASSSKPK